MKHILFIVLSICLGAAFGYAQDGGMTLPLKQTLREGGEIMVPIDNGKIRRIVISVQNLIDGESVFYRSEYREGVERPDNEIGPKAIRTHALDPRISDPEAKILTDRKEIVLDTSQLDQVYIKVEKGMVELSIREKKRSI